MSSTQSFLVVVRDFPGTLSNRLETRKEHLVALRSKIEKGIIGPGGAFANSHPRAGEVPQMEGSMLVVNAESREKVVEVLKQDVYCKKGIWDVDNAQILAFFAPPAEN